MDENLVVNKKSWRPEFLGKELKSGKLNLAGGSILRLFVIFH